MAFPIFRAKNAAQVGMAGEDDAREVVDFALVPIGRAPDAADGGHFGQFARFVVLPARQHDFHHQACFVLDAPKVIDHFRMRFKINFGRLLGICFEIVDARDAVEEIEPQVWLVAQERADIDKPIGRDFDPRIDRRQIRAGNRSRRNCLSAGRERLVQT